MVAATVGRPRLSRISRPWRWVILLIRDQAVSGRSADPFCKSGDDLVNSSYILSDQVGGNLPLDDPFRIAQVLQRRSSADPRQQTGQGVTRCANLKVFDPGHFTNFVEVATPVRPRPFDDHETLFTDVKGLAQKMGETETYIERRVAEMKDFVIEQDQSLVTDKNIFGTIIAVDQGVGASQRPHNKLLEKGSGSGDS